MLRFKPSVPHDAPGLRQARRLAAQTYPRGAAQGSTPGRLPLRHLDPDTNPRRPPVAVRDHTMTDRHVIAEVTKSGRKGSCVSRRASTLGPNQFGTLRRALNCAATVGVATQGQIDTIGFSPSNGGWLISGWLPLSPQLASGLPSDRVLADLAGMSVFADMSATLVFYRRTDTAGRGVGVVSLIKGRAELAEAMAQITIRFGRTNFKMERAPGAVQLPEPDMIRHCRILLKEGFAGNTAGLTAVLRADAYAGVSTLEALPDYVRVGIDELIVLHPEGAVILGWMLAWPGTVVSLAVCSEAGTALVQQSRMIATERVDVLEAGGRDKGFEDSRCGFVAFVEGRLPAGGPAWLRVEGEDGRVGYATIPDRRLRGMRAMQRILDATEVHTDDMRRALDTVVGPACRLLNAERLAYDVATVSLRFGPGASGPARHDRDPAPSPTRPS